MAWRRDDEWFEAYMTERGVDPAVYRLDDRRDPVYYPTILGEDLLPTALALADRIALHLRDIDPGRLRHNDDGGVEPPWGLLDEVMGDLERLLERTRALAYLTTKWHHK